MARTPYDDFHCSSVFIGYLNMDMNPNVEPENIQTRSRLCSTRVDAPVLTMLTTCLSFGVTAQLNKKY
jgi:hypothetical protein